jgi:hypothetical protein
MRSDSFDLSTPPHRLFPWCDEHLLERLERVRIKYGLMEAAPTGLTPDLIKYRRFCTHGTHSGGFSLGFDVA